jgi:hypothetical protein
MSAIIAPTGLIPFADVRPNGYDTAAPAFAGEGSNFIRYLVAA